MAETFFIKKTAFDDTSNSLGMVLVNSFVIGPGELNGPAGITRNSDLRLYGFGAAKWGEGVDQSMFRILENSACLRKVTGDYNPNNPSIPYDSSTMSVLPKDEKDLGIGNGITLPVLGQLWYDTTALSRTVFVWNGNNWITAGQDPGTITINAGTMSINDLECNGQAVSRTRFAALFASIGTTFGVGDGSTTFNVPTIASPGANLIYVIRT